MATHVPGFEKAAQTTMRRVSAIDGSFGFQWCVWLKDSTQTGCTTTYIAKMGWIKYLDTAILMAFTSEVTQRSDKLGTSIASLPMVIVHTVCLLCIQGESGGDF
ncbi:MAG: hypothetical protein EVA59_05190 [Limnobacter sp.]|uniref:hypothetical protein n=1 Tax=Limnobacter sp. TaxID=2003368 RepID=UPI0012259ACE|nr:hypothetical protein [Limnobacter sp.]RZO93723.1 MAG: hypothetical protein EVA59_05190 [Limnobacter sp.]